MDTLPEPKTVRESLVNAIKSWKLMIELDLYEPDEIMLKLHGRTRLVFNNCYLCDTALDTLWDIASAEAGKRAARESVATHGLCHHCPVIGYWGDGLKPCHSASGVYGVWTDYPNCETTQKVINVMQECLRDYDQELGEALARRYTQQLPLTPNEEQQ